MRIAFGAVIPAQEGSYFVAAFSGFLLPDWRLGQPSQE
jgi:hypothetical protein